MTDSPNATTPQKPKPTKRATYELSSVVQTVASKRKMNATDAGKRTRGYIRAHRAELVKVWPALKNHDKGNRYPTMPVKARNAILSGLKAS